MDFFDIVDRGIAVTGRFFSNVFKKFLKNCVLIIIGCLLFFPWILPMYLVGRISIYRENKRFGMEDVK